MPRTVFITGASRGIGAAIAARFGEAGFAVIAPSRVELDLASTDSVRAYVAGLGPTAVDVLVNNAGENKVNLIPAIGLDDWERILTVNLTSAFLLTQALAPGMAGRGYGRVVNVASVYGLVGRPGRAAYSASKSALIGLTRAAALEFGERGVLVNAVCPGFVETDMTRQNNTEAQRRALAEQTAVKRLAQPREIAELVYFLGSELNSYVTGQAVVIDGGFCCQ